MIKVEDGGLFLVDPRNNDDAPTWICNAIRVVARVRHSDYQSGYGILLAWKTPDDNEIRFICKARLLLTDAFPVALSEMIDRGFLISTERSASRALQQYLSAQIGSADPAVITETTGWHGENFVSTDWAIGQGAQLLSPICTQQGPAVSLRRQRSIDEWVTEVADLCRGNPMLQFAIGAALAAPLLRASGLESGGVHIVGSSSTGKTTLLRIAVSVYSDSTFQRSWAATANGLAAVAAVHNDMLLPLDELGMARPEDVDLTTYQICNGISKARALGDGRFAGNSSWRTLVLSNGEISIAESLRSIGRDVRAGQTVRFLEVPCNRPFGVFDNLHGFASPASFADYLRKACGIAHGSLFPEWLLTLTDDKFYRDSEIMAKIGEISERWTKPEMGSQVRRCINRFGLIAVALSLAAENNLLPWTAQESIDAVKAVLEDWLDHRGHTQDAEHEPMFSRLSCLLPKWQESAANSQYNPNPIFSYTHDKAELLCIHPEFFKSELRLPKQYRSYLSVLEQNGWLYTNERTRGTLKISVGEKSQRVFALDAHKAMNDLRLMGFNRI